MIEKFELVMHHPLGMHDENFTKRGLSLSSMEQAGLLIRSEKDGSHYDRFRGRVMFPIYTLQGKVIAFSGRALGMTLRNI